MNKKILFLSVCLLVASVVFCVGFCKTVKKPQVNEERSSMAEQLFKIMAGGTFRNENMVLKSVPFEKLPAVCKEDCDSEKELYGNDAKHASVGYVDLDNDGSDEMIVSFRSYTGNGGTAYDILTKRNGMWIKSDEFFGVFWHVGKINGRIGLFLDSKCGGTERNYSFNEFKNGKLVPTVSINVERGFVSKKNHRLTIKVHSAEEADFGYLF